MTMAIGMRYKKVEMKYGKRALVKIRRERTYDMMHQFLLFWLRKKDGVGVIKEMYHFHAIVVHHKLDVREHMI